MRNISETFFKFIETVFKKVSEWDIVRNIIKSGIMFHLKRIGKFQNEEKWRSKKWTFSLLII